MFQSNRFRKLNSSASSISLLSVLIIALLVTTISCSKKDNDQNLTGPGEFTYDAPWPTDMASILTYTLPDSTGDQIALSVQQDGPPYSGPVEFPSIDLTSIQLGIDSVFLYMRVDFAGVIPTAAVHLQAEGEIEEQLVKNQGMNIALNTDNNLATGGGGEGVSGIDIFFAISFHYGVTNQVYCNYDFDIADVHANNAQIEGELGEGGPGESFAIVRYDISGLGDFLPLDGTVDIGSWSEAESFNLDGSLKYHHFAFDRLPGDTTWTVQ